MVCSDHSFDRQTHKKWGFVRFACPAAKSSFQTPQRSSIPCYNPSSPWNSPAEGMSRVPEPIPSPAHLGFGSLCPGFFVHQASQSWFLTPTAVSMVLGSLTISYFLPGAQCCDWDFTFNYCHLLTLLELSRCSSLLPRLHFPHGYFQEHPFPSQLLAEGSVSSLELLCSPHPACDFQPCSGFCILCSSQSLPRLIHCGPAGSILPSSMIPTNLGLPLCC